MELNRGNIKEELRKVEEDLGYKLCQSYVDFYVRYGYIDVDDFLVIVSPEESKYTLGVQEHINSVKKDEKYLSEGFEDYDYIKYYDGETGWLPVGFTSNGDVVFCNNREVMVTDAGLDDREVHKKTLIEFVEGYLKGEIESRVFPDDVYEYEHFPDYQGERRIHVGRGLEFIEGLLK